MTGRAYYSRDYGDRRRTEKAKPPKTDAEKEADQRRGIDVWCKGGSYRGTATERYLSGRGIGLDVSLCPDGDGYHETIRHSQDLTQSPMPPCYSGMVCAVNDAYSGLVVAIHRVPLHGDGRPYLRPDGNKQKWSLGPIMGNSWRGSCWPDPDGRWGIIEGIEKALAVTQLMRFLCWSSITADNMKLVRPPSWARHAYIFADNDENEVGLDAAADTLAALRTVPHLKSVRVIMAEALNSDMSDILQELPYGR
jgi:Toprim domain